MKNRITKLLVLPMLLLVFGVVFAACGNKKKDDGKTNTDPTPVAVTGVTITGDSVILVGTATDYTAVISPSNATVKTVTWAVKTGTAAITTDGTLTATAAGSVTISATSNNNKVGEKTITVYADQAAADDADITAAKGIVEGATYTAPQSTAADITAAHNAVQAVIDTLSLNGVTTEIVDGQFAGATTGTVTTPNGDNGSFTFTVKLNKGDGTEQVTGNLTLTITATPYDNTQDNADIGTAKTAVEGATYTAPQATVTDITAANARVQAVIGNLTLNGVTAEIVNGQFAGATTGTVVTPDGVDGSFTFTVKLNKGLGAEQITKTLTLTIDATVYVQTDAEKIAAAKTAVQGILDNVICAPADCDTNQHTREYITGLISHIGDLYGVGLNVNINPFNAAVIGTVENAAGSDGSATIIVTITCGTEAPEPVSKNVTIETTTDFTDTHTIQNAKEIIEDELALQSTVLSSAANTQPDLLDIINGICNPVKTSHSVTANITDEDFKAAVNGTAPDAGNLESYIGNDGGFTCRITIEKNNGTPEIINVNITIAAQDFVTSALSFTPITEGSDVIGYAVSANGLGEADTGIVIPTRHADLPVLKIAGNGFQSATDVKVVIIPNSVTEIGLNAFYGCTSLQHIEIPNSVETITSGAFQNCTALAGITLPENAAYTTITSDLFREAGLTEIIIPGKVTEIEGTAFFNCTALTDVTLGGVQTIGNSAFNGCSALTELTLTAEVTSVGAVAFNDTATASSDPFVLTIENPNIQFRGVNIFTPNSAVEIYFNGTKAVFDTLEVYSNTAGTWEPSGTLVQALPTLPEKTKVYFNDPADQTYGNTVYNGTSYTNPTTYNAQP